MLSVKSLSCPSSYWIDNWAMKEKESLGFTKSVIFKLTLIYFYFLIYDLGV